MNAAMPHDAADAPEPAAPSTDRAEAPPETPGRPDLAAERCGSCRADAPRLEPAEIAVLAAEVPEWRVTERNGVPRLERTFPMPSYLAGLEFARRVGLLAEEADHHPAIVIEYGRVTVRWWTHAIRGLHRNDVVMAARTDRLYEAGEWGGA